MHLPVLTHEYFLRLVEQSFLVKTDDRSLALKVTEVRMLPAPRRRSLSGKEVDAAAQRAPFCVFFRSEGEMGLRQGAYALTPPDGEHSMDIFLVPLGFEDGGVVYEAVFN